MEASGILIFTRDENLFSLCRMGMEGSGFAVYRARDIREGLKILGKKSVQAVILDSCMIGRDLGSSPSPAPPSTAIPVGGHTMPPLRRRA